MIRPGADAVHQRHGPGVRQRQVRARSWTQGAGAGRLERLRGARRRVEGARQAARPRHRDVPRMDRRQRVRGARHRRGRRPTARSRSSPPPADGAGHRDDATRSWPSTCSACRSRRSASCIGDTDRGNGFGSAGSRSLFTGGSAVQRRLREDGATRRKDLAAKALEAAAADIEYADGVFRVAGTDRGIGLFELAARQPERRIFIDTHQHASAARAGRTAATSARSRSIRRPATVAGRRLCLGQRRRPRGQPDDRARPARRRRGAGHRPGAVRARGLRRRDRASR